MYVLSQLLQWPFSVKDELIKESLQHIIPFKRLSFKLFQNIFLLTVFGELLTRKLRTRLVLAAFLKEA